MKIHLQILIFFWLTSSICLGQAGKIPKNLKQAMVNLNRDCPDSIKKFILNSEDNRLKEFCYPYRGNFKVVFNWIGGENRNSRLGKYLNSKAVLFHHEEVLWIALKQHLLGLRFAEDSILEPFQQLEIRWANEDKVRFTTDTLRSLYIPKDIDDCFKQINSFWADSTKTKMKNLDENEFGGRLHLGFGMWMRNNWQLWGGSRLSKYFNEKGIFHPDDMSGIILTSYHRYLNQKEIKFEDQIKTYQEYWEKAKIEYKENNERELSKYKKGDTVTYKYHLGYVSKKQEKKDEDDICVAKGIIISVDTEKYLIKIRLIESCDRRGIIYFDNKDSEVFNNETKKWEQPKKRIIKHMKYKQENWFKYDDWEINN